MRLVRALRGIRVIRLLRPPSSKSQGWTMPSIGCAQAEQQTLSDSQLIHNELCTSVVESWRLQA